MKGSSSPNDTQKPRKKLPKRPFFDSADRHEKLYGRSRLYASAQGRHETGGVLSLFSRLSFDISIQNSVQRWSSDFQGLFRVKIRKMAQGSDDLSTLPLRHHYRARNWTFDENHCLVSSYSSSWNGSSGENRVNKFSGEVGINAIKVAWLHWFSVQSCTKNWPFLCVHFHNFLFLLTFKRLMPWFWNLAHFLSAVFSPIPC